MTTMKGVRSIGLNYTYSFDADETVLPRDENSLSRINSDPYLRSYNERINAEFGTSLVPILTGQVCEFPLNRDNLLAVTGSLAAVRRVYGQCYRVRFACDRTILKSHHKFFESYVRNLGAGWPNGMEVIDAV